MIDEGQLIATFDAPEAEELEIRIYKFSDSLGVRVTGDAEVGTARFFLTPDELIQLGAWFITEGIKHVDE